jgi:dihydropteroate synthase
MFVKDSPIIMGIVNVTPDSFSDGGLFCDKERAVEHGLSLIGEGADIVDVGGESTRPGSSGVSEEEEKRRVLPVIEGLAKKSKTVISIDTVKPGVARDAVALGAQMINDVSMLRNGNELARVAAETGVYLVLMHSRKTPKDMQQDISYGDVVEDVASELKRAAHNAESVGVDRSRIWIDPGIGFAKTVNDNLEILARLPELVEIGYPVVVGPSRKSFIGKLTGADTDTRLGGSAASITASILGGATAVRVHDVGIMGQAAFVAYAIARTQFGKGGFKSADCSPFGNGEQHA